MTLRSPEDLPGDAAGTRTCNSCGLLNSARSEYCTSCGAPLGLITAITGVGGADAPRSASAWRVYGVETGIFGRQRDFDRLVDTFQRAIDQRACQLLALSGPQGIGKTRLVAEFNEKLDQHFDGAHLVAGAGRSAGGPPYAALSRMIKSRFYIHEQEQGQSARQKLLDGVHATLRNPLAEEIAHMVGYLIGLPYPNSTIYARYGNDPGRIVERARGALIKLLEKDAERQPLVLVLEDLHFAGPESLELFRSLHDNLTSSPILLLCVVQPELKATAPWLFEPGPRRHLIDLNPLDDVDVHALVNDILRRAGAVPEELHNLICERSFGNPLSIEGVIRVLIDTGVVDTRNNTWIIHADRLDRVELPNTFEGLVRARLDGLTAEERAVLEKASLVGHHFWPEAIQALDRLEQPRVPDDDALWPGQAAEERVVEVLKVLNSKDMIRRRKHGSDLPGHDEYAFKHEIERQIVYESIDPELRKRYHLITAQWMEAAADEADLRDRFMETVALHHERGVNLPRAADLYIEAGRNAARHYRNRTAVGNFERALAFLGETNLSLHIEVLHDIGTVLDLMGEPERALDFYEELLQSAWLIGNRAKVAVALNKLGRAHRTLGNYDRALSDLNRALALFRFVEDLPGIAASLDDIGTIHNFRGVYDKAEAFFLEALSLRQRLDDKDSEALTLNRLGSVKLNSGDFREALRLFRESLNLRRISGDRPGAARSLNNLAILFQERGELSQALVLLRDAEATAREIGDRILLGTVLNNIGEGLLDLNDLVEAQSALEQAVEITRETGERRVHFDALRNLARLQHCLGHDALALDLASRAEQLARQLDAPVLIAIALRTRGELLAATLDLDAPDSDRVVQAEECFRQSIKQLTEIGNESELGRCYSAYGDFLLKQGLTIQGRKRLEMAKAIFARLEMKRVLEKTERTIDDL